MEYLAVFAVGYIVGWWWRGIMVMYKLSRNPESAIKMLEELKEIHEHEAKGTPINETRFGTGIEINVEVQKGIYYLFVKETDQFVGQGTDLAQAMEEAAKRFPNKELWCKELKQDNQTA